MVILTGYCLLNSKKEKYTDSSYFLFYEYPTPNPTPLINVYADDLPSKNVYNNQMRRCLDYSQCQDEQCLNECAVTAVMATGFVGDYPPLATFVNPITFKMEA